MFGNFTSGFGLYEKYPATKRIVAETIRVIKFIVIPIVDYGEFFEQFQDRRQTM